jgi:hypothetical protein
MRRLHLDDSVLASPRGRRSARPARLALAALASLHGLVAAGGCGSDDGGETPRPGDVVWSARVTTLVIASEGGGFLPTPPGSECQSGAAEHTLLVSALRLSSRLCEGAGGAPHRLVERSRELTAAQLTELSPALERLQVVDEQSCGADKPAITLKVTADGATREYRDSFYGCLPDPRPQVDSAALDEVFGRLNALVNNG